MESMNLAFEETNKEDESNKVVMSILKAYTKKYPGIWSKLDKIHAMNEDFLQAWPGWCYAPIERIGAILEQLEEAKTGRYREDFFEFIEIVKEACAVNTLALWRQSKEVFLFDKDFEMMLGKQDIEDIPSEIFFNIPYPSVYIKLKGVTYWDKEVEGFFANLCSFGGKIELLEILFVSSDHQDLMLCLLPMNGNSLIEAFYECSHKPLLVNPDTKRLNMPKEIENESDKAAVNKAVQMLLYLCSENSKIAAVRPNRIRRTDKVRDTLREIREWKVGEEIGVRIRMFRKEVDSDNEGNIDSKGLTNMRRSPAPHMRRSHWHHYWTGKMDDPTNRKLVLRWIEPTFVAGEQVNAVSYVHI